MCPYEEWLGFCPFVVPRRIWSWLVGQHPDNAWRPVQWITERRPSGR
jgi:hypothetical protein